MKHRTFTLIEILITFFVLFILAAIILPTLGPGHPLPKRYACASNLKQIYTAMFLYSQDYSGDFPHIDPGKETIVGEDTIIINRVPGCEENPFKDIPETAGRSISQNLWLLVRSEMAQPEIFNCPCSVEQAEQKFHMKDKVGQDRCIGPMCFVDFPYEKSGMTISYSFVQPWTRFKKSKGSWNQWCSNMDPRFIIGADMNNGKQPNYSLTTMPASLPANKNDMKEYVNSTNHDGDGQNALYGDGHVNFEKSSYVGIKQDNIYTAQPADYVGEAGKTPGVLSVRPKDETDSVLIPNREADLKAWDRKP